MLIKIQPDATVCRYLYTTKSLYMFRVSQHPSSGVLETVHKTSPDQATLGVSSCTDIMTSAAVCGTVLVLLMMGAVTPETCRVT